MPSQVVIPNRVYFPVAEVVPATSPLPTQALNVALATAVRSPVVACDNPEEPIVTDSDYHPLIAAAALAFKGHYPLVLSPDMIWITILQGVAQHIANHARALRHRLVRHETKIELVVETDSGLPITESQMLVISSKFVEKIGQHVLPDKRFLIGTEFTTTTTAARIAGCIAFMDAMQPYFDYVLMCICGIPAVILEGTPDDWELLHAKVQALHESDLELTWWTEKMLPLTRHFVRASRGDVDVEHWKDLCKVMKSYGTEDLNGWLLKFIPYIRRSESEPPIERNPVLEFHRYPDKAKGPFEITGCSSNNLPGGLSRAAVTVQERPSGFSERFDFVSGFTGVTQDKRDLSLTAHIGWALVEPSKIDRLISELQKKHSVNAPAGLDARSLAELFGGELPPDFWRFYTETDGAQIDFANGPNSYRLFQACQLAPVWKPGEEGLRKLNKEQGWSVSDFQEWRTFANRYGTLIQFAESGDSTFVFGQTPEGLFADHSHAVLRWTGELKPEAFTPEAHTFSDWLEQVLAEK